MPNFHATNLPPGDAQLSGIAIYENVRALPGTSRHLAFDCQVFGTLSGEPIIANLRYFNSEGLEFAVSEPGAMMFQAHVTRWTPGVDLYLMTGEDGLNESDFTIIGDIYSCCPITNIKDLNYHRPPTISISGAVTKVDDKIIDPSIDQERKISTFELCATQYTSYHVRDTPLGTLPIKAFFQLDDPRYAQYGPPLPHRGRIVHIIGFVVDVVCIAGKEPTHVVIRVDHITSLGDVPIHMSPKEPTAHDAGDHKRKFRFSDAPTAPPEQPAEVISPNVETVDATMPKLASKHRKASADVVKASK